MASGAIYLAFEGEKQVNVGKPDKREGSGSCTGPIVHVNAEDAFLSFTRANPKSPTWIE